MVLGQYSLYRCVRSFWLKGIVHLEPHPWGHLLFGSAGYEQGNGRPPTANTLGGLGADNFASVNAIFPENPWNPHIRHPAKTIA